MDYAIRFATATGLILILRLPALNADCHNLPARRPKQPLQAVD